MKFNQALALLSLLSSRPDGAITAQTVVRKWNDAYTERLNLRTAQRYLSELSSDGKDSRAVLEVDTGCKEWRYYLRLSEVASWLMTEEVALIQALSLQVVKDTFSGAVIEGLERHLDAALHLVEGSGQSKRLRDRIRIVPDGIGRLPARVDQKILSGIMDALGSNQLLRIKYAAVTKKKESSRDINPLGLVAKDGTLYLLGVEGLCDSPIHYAAHRLISVQVLPKRAPSREDFDLDRYIHDSHQLSHVLHSEMSRHQVILKVHTRSLFHFKERPLSEQQSIVESEEHAPWAIVTVSIPNTVLLKPFLASFGPDLEVLEPPLLRAEMVSWCTESANLYAGSTQPL